MPGWLYDAGPNGLWTFLLVTLVLGGLAAYVSGRAIAQTWRPPWQLPPYMLLLAAGVRFIQWSVLGAALFSPPSLAVDFLVLTAIAAAGYVMTRREQMARQYGWLGDRPGA